MDDFTKMAMEMVKAQAGVRVLSSDEMVHMVKEIAAKLRNMTDTPGQESEANQQTALVGDAKKSIKAKSITCLECGKSFKILSKKHLAQHGLTAQEYREKFGLKKGIALAAKDLVKARREKMQEMELWKKRGLGQKKPQAGAGQEAAATTPAKKPRK